MNRVRFKNISGHIYDNIHYYLSAFGALFLGFSPHPTSWQNIVGVVLVFFAAILTIVRQRVVSDKLNHYESLKKLELDYFDIWEMYIRQLYFELKFSDRERISLYRFSKQHQKFIMIGRFSESPELIKRGRAVTSASEGCIGFAWNKGCCFATKLPDYRKNPKKYLNETLENWKIKKAVAKKFSMKSRSFFASAITDPSNSRRLAVIVFESMSQHSLTKKAFIKFVKEKNDDIATLIKKLRKMEPSLATGESWVKKGGGL